MKAPEMLKTRIVRAACLSSILLLAEIAPVSADYLVTVHFSGVNPSHSAYISQNGGSSWIGTLAGKYNWGSATGTGTSIIGTSFSSFCIEISQHINSGSSYTYTLNSNIAALPLPGGGMGATKAQQVGYLVNAFKSGTAGFTDAAVVQGAIWNIINETTPGDHNTYTGTLRVNDQANSSATTYGDAINTMLTNVYANYSSYNASVAAWNLVGLTNNSFQDQIVALDHSDFMGAFAPAPSGLFLSGFGLLLAGGCHYLRKRGNSLATR